MTRHVRISLLALLATIACSGERRIENGIVLAAPDSYVGASVLLDGKKIGELQYLFPFHGGPVQLFFVNGTKIEVQRGAG